MVTAGVFYHLENWGDVQPDQEAWIEGEIERICRLFREAGWEETDQMSGTTDHHTLFWVDNGQEDETVVDWFELWCANDEKRLKQLIHEAKQW